MKKILPALVLISFLAVLAIPTTMVSAQAGAPESCIITHEEVADLEGIDCPTSGECLFSDPDYDCGMCCVMNSIYTITDWIFIILVAFAAVMVLFGAFTLLTAGGVPEKVTSGRNYIIYAAIGLAVGLLAKAIPAIVRVILGV
jgi:hypothetical protein